MNPLKLRDQWGYSETSRNGWITLWDYVLQFLKKLKLHTKLSPEKVH